MAQAIGNSPVIRDSQGEQSNPTTATVMADTGEIQVGGIYEVLVIFSSDVVSEFVVQVRDTTNTTNVGDVHVFYAPASAPTMVPLRFEIDRDQRVRVLPNANITGNAVASIFATRVA